MADTRKKKVNLNSASKKRPTANARTAKSSTAKKARSTTAPRKNARTTVRKERYIPDENDLMVRREVKVLLLLAVSVLLLLSNFDLCGKVGQWLSYFMFGVFGLYAYIVPVLLVLGGAFLISNRGSHKAHVRFVACTLLLVLLCGIMQMLVDSSRMELSSYYSVCAENRTGGGVIGGIIVTVLRNTIGVVGAYVVLFILTIADMVVVTGQSVLKPLSNTGKRAFRSAKDQAKIHRNAYRQQREEELLEKDQEEMFPVSRKKGKMRLSTTKLTKGQQNEVHEIKPSPVSKLDESIFDKFNNQEEEPEDFHEEVVPVMPEFSRNLNPADVNAHEIKKAMEEPVEQVDEEGYFKPKEQIVVSKEAKDVMARKPFQSVSQVKVHTNGQDAGDIRKIPEQKIVEEKSQQVGQVPPEKPVVKPNRPYVPPPLSLLNRGERKGSRGNHQMELKETAIKLQQTLQNFGVGVTITDVSRGPSVTRYELQPEQGTKVSKITALTDDIKLNLAASDIRIEAPIPGKAAVGIEVPNPGRDTVYFRELIESEELRRHPSKLAFAAGKDIAGKVVVADIAKMPHMLIAGTTGSGKSVFTNSIIMSILYRAKPNEVKLIIVDPKVVEFGVYNGIPHLLIPVVTDPRKAAGALNWAVAEMQDRYKKFAELGVRDLPRYNQKIEKMPECQGMEKLPQIVIIIDELADLMMAAAKEVEEAICRLAQLARAAGIHLVIATQRPSVDVVTGLIKANIPSRVALLVSSGTDSRTIIDMNGAEKLLGNGDMLFYPSGYVKPVRLQGAFISDTEVSKVVSFIKQNSTMVSYDTEIRNKIDAGTQLSMGEDSDGYDAYFEDAAKFVVEKERASTSMLQRVFKIGYNRAARIMDQLTEAGIVGAEEGTKPRRVLKTKEELDTFLNNENQNG